MPGIYELERTDSPKTTIIFLTAEQAQIMKELYKDLGFKNMIRLGHGQ